MRVTTLWLMLVTALAGCIQVTPASRDVATSTGPPGHHGNLENPMTLKNMFAFNERAAQEIRGAALVGIPNGGHLEGGTWIELLWPHIRRIVQRA